MITWSHSVLAFTILSTAASSPDSSYSKLVLDLEDDASDDIDSSWQLVGQFVRTSPKCSWIQESVQVRGSIGGLLGSAGV